MMSSRKSPIKLYHINEFYMAYDEVDMNNELFQEELPSGPNLLKTLKRLQRSRKSDFHKQFRRGVKAYEANHVKSFIWDPDARIIKGSVKPSFTSSGKYNVTVFLKENYSVSKGECDCARGIACHHIGALLFCAHYNLSVTDIACQWKAGKGNDRNDGLNFDELFPTQKEYKAITPLTDDEIVCAAKEIFTCGRGCAGFDWILQAEPDVTTNEQIEICHDLPSIPSILDAVKSMEYKCNSDKFKFLLSKVQLQPSVIYAIADATKNQTYSFLWIEGRRYRVTGSIFGPILRAAKSKRKLAPSLLRRICEKALLSVKQVSKMKTGKYSEKMNAAQWGSLHEATAKSKFTEVYGLPIVETGLWIHECGILGASPDGLIGYNGIIEVKCPFQFKNETSLKNCLLNSEDFFQQAPSKRYAIYLDEDTDEWVMWEEHDYYHQVQGELWCSYREMCYFVVWIPNDMAVTTIYRSDEWYAENFPKLLKCYQDEVLPVIEREE